MEILPQTKKVVPGVTIPEKVKLSLFVEAYSQFNRSLYTTDDDPATRIWAAGGEHRHAEICWVLWELGLYDEFLESTERSVWNRYEELTR